MEVNGVLLMCVGVCVCVCVVQLEVPVASSVAVVVGDLWSHLQTSRPPSSSVWEGEVDLAQSLALGSKLFVCANYGSSDSSYHTLLKYTI